MILWQRLGPYHHARIGETARLLASEGWEVTGMEVAGVDEYDWAPTAGGQIAMKTLFPNEDYQRLENSKIADAVWRALDSLDPAAVAINGWSVPEAVAAAKWCRRRGRTGILMCGTHEPAGTPRWWKELVKRWRVRRFDCACASGQWHADYLFRLGMRPETVSIGYDVVDNDYFSGGADRARASAEETRMQLGLPEKYFMVNTRFLLRKNVDGIIRAMAEWLQRDPKAGNEWKLVISGSGNMENTWRKLGEDLGVSESIQWRGFVQYDKLPALYGLAEAFVHVAHSEAWGLVVNEAAAAGLPIIAGDKVGATCELIKDGENGILVRSHDVRALAAAFERFARIGKEKRNVMGEQSRAIVSDFGPARFAAAMRRALRIAGQI